MIAVVIAAVAAAAVAVGLAAWCVVLARRAMERAQTATLGAQRVASWCGIPEWWAPEQAWPEQRPPKGGTTYRDMRAAQHGPDPDQVDAAWRDSLPDVAGDPQVTPWRDPLDPRTAGRPVKPSAVVVADDATPTTGLDLIREAGVEPAFDAYGRMTLHPYPPAGEVARDDGP